MKIPTCATVFHQGSASRFRQRAINAADAEHQALQDPSSVGRHTQQPRDLVQALHGFKIHIIPARLLLGKFSSLMQTPKGGFAQVTCILFAGQQEGSHVQLCLGSSSADPVRMLFFSFVQEHKTVWNGDSCGVLCRQPVQVVSLCKVCWKLETCDKSPTKKRPFSSFVQERRTWLNQNSCEVLHCQPVQGLSEAGNMQQTSMDEALRAAGTRLTSASDSFAGNSRLAGTTASNACS